MSDTRYTNANVITNQVCGRCKFSTKSPQGTQGAELECRRNPPFATAIPIGRRDGGEPVFMYHSFYAAVGEHEQGCGEWRPKLTL